MPEPTRRMIRRPPAAATTYADDVPDDEEPSAPAPRAARDSSASPRRSGGVGTEYNRLVGSGWEGHERTSKEMPSDFATTFTIPSEPVLIKFLEAAPFASYLQHWADWMPKGVKKSYVCIKADCPLCEIGNRPAQRTLFNIVDLTDVSAPVNSVLIVGKKVTNLIQTLAKGERSGPLDREDLYYEIYRTGGGEGARAGGTVQTNIHAVKARDAETDWNLSPFTAEELDDLRKTAFTAEDAVPIQTRRELEAVVDAATE